LEELTLTLTLTPGPQLPYLEGDDKVEMFSHFPDVGLAQVAGEADLGLL
jgi:hypothetical protein